MIHKLTHETAFFYEADVDYSQTVSQNISLHIKTHYAIAFNILGKHYDTNNVLPRKKS